MRRSLLLGAATALVAGSLAVLPATAASRSSDRTAPYGPFGFTTVGLGAGPQYGEPSLAMAPDGKHYVASTPGDDGHKHGTVQVWYSSDRGTHWRHTYFTSNSGGGDSEIDFAPNGTLYGADLEVGQNSDSEIHVSHDFGKTWDANGVPAGSEQDRQWFAHTPDGKREFLVYHDLAAEAEFYVESDNGGKSWGQPQLVNDPSQLITAPGIAVAPRSGSTSSILDQGVNTFSGPMMVAKNAKDFYVVYSISNLESNSTPTGGGLPPFGGVRGIVVAHSADAGKTWTNKYAVVAKSNVNTSQEESTGTMFPWGFLDPAGNIYVVYGSTRDAIGTDHYGYYYVYSTNKGKTWSTPRRIDGMKPGTGAVVFNTGGAVKRGVIDVAWLQKTASGIGETTGVWSPWFAQISAANTGHPHIVRQKLTTLPNHKGGVCIQGILCGIAPGSGDRSLLDFFELAVNPKTHLAGVVYADNGGFRPGEGKGEVVFAAQTRQPKLPVATTKKKRTRASTSHHDVSTPATSRNSAARTAAGLPQTGGSLAIPFAALGLLVLGVAGRRRLQRR